MNVTTDDCEWLKALVATLREWASMGALEKSLVANSISVLGQRKYTYRVDKFPPFEDEIPITEELPRLPTNSAEALLWKLGRWKAYQSFLRFRLEPDRIPAKDGVVFYAYAQHLNNRHHPIYDQHALRAIWGICQLSAAEASSFRHVLMNRNQEWKESGTGKQGMICYKLFETQFARLKATNVSNRELDALLMPLGQALKKSCRTYASFSGLISN